MKRKLFLTLGLAALTMYSYGAKKPKTTARKMNKTTIQQPTFTEWHDLQVTLNWKQGKELFDTMLHNTRAYLPKEWNA